MIRYNVIQISMAISAANVLLNTGELRPAPHGVGQARWVAMVMQMLTNGDPNSTLNKENL